MSSYTKTKEEWGLSATSGIWRSLIKGIGFIILNNSWKTSWKTNWGKWRIIIKVSCIRWRKIEFWYNYWRILYVWRSIVWMLLNLYIKTSWFLIEDFPKPFWHKILRYWTILFLCNLKSINYRICNILLWSFNARKFKGKSLWS